VWGFLWWTPFRSYFALQGTMDTLVAGHMFGHNDEVHWDMNFIRLVHDWEVDSVSSFSNAL
jgi:hypothetical protein